MICVLFVYGCFALFRLGSSDLDTDEGRFGIEAINILTDYRQLAIVSEDPLGSAGPKPFLYPLCLAGSVLLFGKNEFALRVVNVLMLAGAGLLTYRLVAFYFKDKWLALLTLLFFLLNPWTIEYARGVIPEAAVVFWGCLGLLAAAKFSQRLTVAWALLCGLTLGFAFLSKVWLAFPFGFACLLPLAVTLMPRPGRLTVLAGIGALALFLVVSAAHLLLVFWLTPADLTHWLRSYLVVNLSGRVVGDSDFDPALWSRPWSFYLIDLFKATFFALPLLLTAAYSIVKKRGLLLTTVLLTLLSPFAIFSLLPVKSTTYVFPGFPALAFLMAYGTAEFLRRTAPTGLTLATVISVLASLLVYSTGAIARGQLVAVNFLYLLYLAAAFLDVEYRTITRISVAAGMLAAMAVGCVLVVRKSGLERTGFRQVGAYFHPWLEHYKPQDIVFKAPEFPAMEFYTFRSGSYWQTYHIHQDSREFLEELKKGSLVFYVVDPTGSLYGGVVSPEKLTALREYAIDVTARIERASGTRIPLKVFVPPPRLAKLMKGGLRDGRR